MMLHGTEMYGEVDVIPGLFHVSTEFYHVNFIPVWPVRSYIVLHGPSNHRLRVGLSRKSIAFAYLRVLCIGLALVGLAWGLGEEFLKGKRKQADIDFITLLLGLMSLLVLFLSYRLSRPTPLRAYRLALQAGLPIHVVADYYAKRLMPEQLDELARQVNPADETATPYESYS
jgi:hypothetical protein